MKTEGSSGGEKNSDYLKELQREKKDLDASAFPNAARLVDEELARGGKKTKEHKPVDVYNDKSTRASVKVMVPVKEHPKFNFVGKLLGPGGTILKKLQEDTQTKMSILGHGSMRDKKKEEELRGSGDPKYAHLNEDLFVEIVAFAPPSEAYARLSFALAEIRKYLTPDDEVPPPQMGYPMGMMEPGPNGMPQGRPRGGMRGEPMRGGLLAPPSLLPRGGPPGPRQVASAPQGLLPRPMSAKSKVMSILDRARAAMEGPYGMEEEMPEGRGGFDDMPYESYAEDSYGKYDEYGGPGMEYGGSRDYYEVNDNFRGKSAGGWKAFASPAGGGPSERSRFRHAPYSRSAK